VLNKKYIAFLDEDQVLRLVWLALCDTAANAEQQIKDWFVPELVDPAAVTKLADGLHPRRIRGSLRPEHVPVIEGRVGCHSSPWQRVVRPGCVRAQPAADPAAWGAVGKHRREAAGVAVSCLPLRTLVYTAEHVLLLMLSLAKGLLAVRRLRSEPGQAGQRHRLQLAGADEHWRALGPQQHSSQMRDGNESNAASRTYFLCVLAMRPV
jgi:hypothetical protein